jgi:quercetin dioxygenase-like cupin family protein
MKFDKKIIYSALLASSFMMAEDLGYYSQLQDRKIVVAPSEHFTGKASVDYLFPNTQTETYGGAYVTFEPKARSDWHTHPAGQHIIVTSGIGYTQEWGKKRVSIKTGDVIWCKPDVKHWHGASENQPMTHLVVTGAKNEKSVEWLEKVNDEQYNGK